MVAEDPRNLAIDRGRRSARELVVDEVEADWRQDEYTVDPALVAEQADAREELLDGLARLPFIYRTAVMLHDAEEWTVAAIAELEEISIPAAKQRLRHEPDDVGVGAGRRRNTAPSPQRSPHALLGYTPDAYPSTSTVRSTQHWPSASKPTWSGVLPVPRSMRPS